MPLVQTRGAASAQGFGEFAQVTAANYIEDVFSTYLYTGNGANRSITNGIDLSTKGGLVWIKSRSDAVSHDLFDTARGAGRILQSNLTAAQVYTTDTQKTLTSFNTDGFSLGDDAGAWGANSNGYTFASWTFRKQPKFFDIVTWTGDGSASWRYINHDLKATPAIIMVKNLTSVSDWLVYSPIAAGSGYDMILNSTAPSQSSNENQGRVYATSSTQFQVINQNSSGGSVTGTNVNKNGDSYVAYLFASNAGGFGLTGLDNVISCGSFTADGSGNATVNLGYEPQFVIMKKTDGSAQDWITFDVLRGWSQTSDNYLRPNSSAAEVASSGLGFPTATGFTEAGLAGAGSTYIYIAIRRGPMKVPTDATKVFAPITFTGSSATRLITGTNFPVDLLMGGQRTGTTNPAVVDRLRGATQAFITPTTSAETTSNGTTQDVIGFDYMDGYKQGSPYNLNINANTAPNVLWLMRRAPSFMDVVCFTGTGAGSGSFAINHNLGVAPELIIFRQRNGTSSWQAGTNFTSTNWRSMFLNLTNAGASQTTYATNDWFAAQPTSTTFTVGWPYYTTGNYVAYLFATCVGVSKVGSYTGNGTTQTINCGFGAGGARFVLIKRTDATGDWYVYDTARGMTVLTDPYLLLNSGAAEVATLGSVTTVSTGFALDSTILAAINVNAGTYIFLAIA